MNKIEREIRNCAANSPSLHGNFSSVLGKVDAESSAINFAEAGTIARRRATARIAGLSALTIIGAASLIVSAIVSPILIEHYIAYNVVRYSADTNHDVFYGKYNCTFAEIIGFDEVKAEDVFFETFENAPASKNGVMHLEEDIYVLWSGQLFSEAVFSEFSKDGALYVGGVTINESVFYCDIIFRKINEKGTASVSFASETEPIGGLFNFSF